MSNEIYAPGLEGVIAGETAISTVEGGLRYRGYAITDLAEKTRYEEVAYLLLHGELPRPAELEAFRQRLDQNRHLPRELLQLWRSLPPALPTMDVLRTAVSFLAHYDPDYRLWPCESAAPTALQRGRELMARIAERLLAQMATSVAAYYRLCRGLEPVPPKSGLSHAAQFLFQLTGEVPDDLAERAFDVSLILYAEHEFNASTFTARVITSTLSDPYSAIVGALGALKGALHGGANEHIMPLLRRIGKPENVEGCLQAMLARKERVMGFGHRVYKTGDLRAAILGQWAQRLAQARGETLWEAIAQRVEDYLRRTKNLFPNLDWPAGRLYYYLGLPVELYTPIFALSRVAGWCAHILEQWQANRLIRPRARYVGPIPRPVVTLQERS
ncbi:MAG: citrate/2-methylcitrate synthase [Gemmatales bacterium]|nr:citrate synthase [Gemmatales bacterium]MCS7161610.1 citrate synthase [Gemmatales bacterium]MDW8176813.1 citrate/2-methylcitrate synthase [Gemmatales bacterium]MDW8221838.1 citrate/2-methylcitrate synthase [Gemmatales bacterium]